MCNTKMTEKTTFCPIWCTDVSQKALHLKKKKTNNEKLPYREKPTFVSTLEFFPLLAWHTLRNLTYLSMGISILTDVHLKLNMFMQPFAKAA